MADGIDIVVRDRIDASINSKIRQLSRSADEAYIKIERLKQILNISSSGGISNIANALNNVGRSASVASTSVQRLNRSSLTNLRNSIQSISKSISNFESGALRAARAIRTIASLGLLAGTGGVVLEKLDTFQNLENQLKITTDSQEQLNEVTARLFDVANRARVPVDDLVKSYRRFDIALKSLGAGQQESLRLTETVGKALILSGSTSNEAAAALLQLSQAFNKGKLDGDEFRSVAELMPIAISKITEVLGISSKEIYAYSRAGKITSEVLREAFKRLAEDVDAQIGSLPRTIGQSFTQLTNAVIKFFGSFDKQFGVTRTIVAFFDYLSANLPLVVKWIKALTVILAALSFGGIIGLLGPLGTVAVAVSGSIASLIAYLAFFSDEIKVTADGVVTLTDLLQVLAGKIPELVSALIGVDLFGSVFSVEGAQKVFDTFTTIGSAVQVFVRETIAALAGFSLAFEQLVIRGEVLKAIEESLNRFLNILANGFLEILAVIGDGVSIAVNSIVGAINQLISVITRIPQSMEKIDLGQFFRDQQVEIAGTTPIMDQFWKQVETFSGQSLLEMTNQWKLFQESIINEARAASAKRIEIERQTQEATKPNESLLRQPTGATNSLNLLKQSSDKTSGSLQGLSRSFGQAGGASNQFRNNIDSATAGTSQLGQGFDDAKSRSQSFIEDTSEGFKSLSDDVQKFNEQATQGLQQIGSGFFDAFDDKGKFDFKKFLGKAIPGLAQYFTSKYNENLSSNLLAAGKRGAPPSGGTSNVASAARTLSAQDVAANERAGTSPSANNQTFSSSQQQFQQLGQTFQTATPSVQQFQQAISQVATSMQAIGTSAQSVTTNLQQLSQQFQGLDQAIQQFGQEAQQQFQQVGQEAQQSGQSISQSITQAFQSATEAVNNYAQNAISQLNAVADAASSVNVGGGGGGGGDFGGGGFFPIFASGGYTGNISPTSIAGVVHGQEYVVPAGPAKRYRPLLEAMRQGKTLATPAVGVRSDGGGSQVNVSVENYGNSQISVQQMSPTDIRIIAREEAGLAARNESLKAVASSMRNPNSKVSKSLLQNTNTQRRR